MAILPKIWPLLLCIGCYDLEFDSNPDTQSCAGVYVCGVDGITAMCVLANQASTETCNIAEVSCDETFDSNLICATPSTTARLQVIHNSADPAAKTVDIYVNDELFLNDVNFRTSSPFTDVPAGVALEIKIAPGTSTSADDAIETFGPYTLAADSKTVLIASGVVDPTAFDANPDGEATGLNLYVIGDAKEAGTAGASNVAVFHGVTDAPTIDVILNNNPTLKPLDDAKYGDSTPYAAFPEGGAVMDVTNSDNTARIASFAAAVPATAVVVVASGFVNDAQNAEAPFGLYAYFATGGAGIPLPAAARLQVIHNSADPAAAMVDVYLNDKLTLNDFAFRSATPFITVPPGEAKISIAASTSTAATDAAFNQNVTFEGKKTYVAVAKGLITPGDFAVNPDAESTALGLTIIADAREKATDPTKVELVVVHGGTDAPTVDLLTGNATIFSALSYGDISAYTAIEPAAIPLSLRVVSNQLALGPFTFDATGFTGRALTVLASGFLDPAQNKDGTALGLVGYTAAGGPGLLLLPAN